MPSEMRAAESGSLPVRQARPDVGVLGRNPRVPLYRARTSIAAVFAALALDVLMLAAVCGSAWAARARADVASERS